MKPAPPRSKIGNAVVFSPPLAVGEAQKRKGKIVDEVWTIELSDEYFTRASSRFSARSDVHVIHGRSEDRLPAVLADVVGPAVFWLDGHWSGGDTAGEERECPILDEIAAIDAWDHAGGSAILIDDARLFRHGRAGGVAERMGPRHSWSQRRDLVDDLAAARFATRADAVAAAVGRRSRLSLASAFFESGGTLQVPRTRRSRVARKAA